MTPERLKEWREGRGLSVKRAVEICRIGSRNSWSSWEAPGGTPPKWLGLVIAAVNYNLPPYGETR